MLDFSPSLARRLKRHQDRIAGALFDLQLLYDGSHRLSGNTAPDLPWSDWVALSALLLDFRPTLILELGRGAGMSTALFQYWSRTALGCSIVSLCNTTHWQDTTAPGLAAVLPLDWARDLSARVGDICEADYGAVLANQPRVLVLWDAHGLAIADTVAAEILPRLPAANIVVAHDMRDARYFPTPDAGCAWRREGHMLSTFDQIAPIARYCRSARTQLRSASHELRRTSDALKSTLHFDAICYWHYFCASTASISA